MSQMAAPMAEKDMTLWDDSALINAFNNAMTKYRDMHKNPSKDIGLEDAKTGTETFDEGRDIATCNTSSDERNKETIETALRDSHTSLPDSGAIGQAAESQHNYAPGQAAESQHNCAPGQAAESQHNCTPGQAHSSEYYGAYHTWPSIEGAVRDSHTSLPDSGATRQAAESQHNCTPGQGAESQHNCTPGQAHGSETYGAYHTWPSMQMNCGDEHARLLSHYYDLEKQRQEVLQQLYQFNGWNCQATNEQAISSAQWNGYSSLQGIQGASYHPQCCPILPYCHPYPQYWPTQPPLCMGSCSHHAPCASSGAGISNNEPHCQCWDRNATCPAESNNTVQPSKALLAADNIAETISEALKKAMSTVKEEISRVDNECKGEMEIDKPGEGSSDTDVTEMLHAWFSAGFHTARCFSRKASADKKH